jgi:hypothetical protein
MKITKRQLENLIMETLKEALEGLDFGDRDWLQSRRQDSATMQQVMTTPPPGSPSFGQLIQAAQVAFRKIQTTGDQKLVNTALPMRREVEQLSKAPQNKANILRARMIVGKLIALSKQG